MENSSTANQNPILIKKDYFLVTFIGVCFALFSIPILKNLNLHILQINFKNVILLVIFFGIFANIALWIAAFIGRKIPIILQLAKFGAVGAFNTFLDWGILNLLIALTGIFAGIGYIIFKGISFLAANVSSYYWNKYWTFNSKENTSAAEFGKFFVISLIGMIVNVIIASVVVNVIGPKGGLDPKKWANVGAAAATIISLVWNFVGYKLWVFKK
jgi:putative flippase GtrA